MSKTTGWWGSARAIAWLARRVASGYRAFRRTGVTPHEAYSAMRALYCATNGRSNELIARAAALRHPPRFEPGGEGVLGVFDRPECERAVANLRTEGLHVFERRLAPPTVKALVDFALRMPANPLVVAEGESLTEFEFKSLPACRFDSANPVSSRYNFASQVVAEQSVVQQLLADPTILEVARAYLRTEPVIDLVAMWWSSAYLKGKASSVAAQYFHFDMDRIKFLKFFFYLTDVRPENGPHCYVRGSHRRKPRALRREGRIGDDEMLRHYSRGQIAELTGAAGTIIAADTSGFHKGKALSVGERLLLQLEFSTDLFGAAYSQLTLTDRFSPGFRRRVEMYPRLYKTFRS